MPDPTNTDAEWEAELAKAKAEWQSMQPEMRKVQAQAAESIAADQAQEQKVRAMRAKAFENLPPDVWEEEAPPPGTEDPTPGLADVAGDKTLEYFDLERAAESGGGLRWSDMSEHIGEELAEKAVEKVAGHTKKRVGPPPVPKDPARWYYAADDETHGPVGEGDLLDLLRGGGLPLSALVWNKAMENWEPASDTPLAAKLEEDSPPPLPKAKKKRAAPKKDGKKPAKKATKKRAKGKARRCPTCETEIEPEDRFCPGCGAPASS